MKRRVLFLCTGNSARSVLAEATLRAWAGNRFEVLSAGSQPTGSINPYALTQLAAEGIPTAGLRSKSWDEFATPDAVPIDLVITVCDSAAAETCPVVFGDFLRAHWGLPDPAAVEGDDEAKADVFREAHRILKARLNAFLALPAEVWGDRAALKQALDRIGFVEPEDETADDRQGETSSQRP
ncbi:arsenate reductase ArsC [Luteimonas sp. JM171]|uniref:arsenate reductase ArsC n=1 Tax=Luteimonas sp. JM171 TaxID=1896164 RepID=UPI000855C85F|nr:arsenate reductase ArsC [Luteimonas sp. JM171]AOH36977.1 ArsC family transcriptional regulator [Luteimonas sp. JM171]